MIKKIFYLLTNKQKTIGFFVLLGMFFVAVLETLSIALIGSSMSILTNNEVNSQYPEFLSFLNSFEEMFNTENKIFMVFSFLCFVFLFKNLTAALVIWMQYKFVFLTRASLSKKIFSSYLSKDILFHKQKNTSELINSLVNETNIFGSHGLNPILTIIIEVFITIGISLFLLSMDPKIFVFILISLLLLYLLYSNLLSKKVIDWGEQRTLFESSRVKSIQEGLGSVKEILLRQKQDRFLEEYAIPNHNVANVMIKQSTLQALPRMIFETIGILFLIFYIIFQTNEGQNLNQILPTLAVYLAAAVRILPSLSRTAGAFQNITFAKPVVSKFYDFFCSELETSSDKRVYSSSLVFLKEITLTDVSFCYSNQEKPVISSFNEKIKYGESVGIIGPSGSGKSTLVDILLGLIQPDSGLITIDGNKLSNNKEAWQNIIGYVPQDIFLMDSSLKHNITFGEIDIDIDSERLEKAIELSKLTDFCNSLPQNVNTLVGERGNNISGGQRQRIGIARALYRNPSILILDEATSSLDLETEQKIVQELKQLKGKVTMITIAHRQSALEACDRIIDLEALNGI